MIPAYNEEVKIEVKEKDTNLLPLEQQIRQLQEHMRQLQETVEFMNRERSRLKSELDQIKNLMGRRGNES